MTATSDDTQGAGSDDDEPMAEVRPPDPAGTALARARMLGALFNQPLAGGRFGRFRVIARLGAGGMGVVYEAYDPDLARGVALKLVDVASVDREAALAEAKALARLSHPHVVPIFDVGFEAAQVYLVMELVRGETLRSWPRGRAVRDILAAYQQAGAALAAAHEAGLVHRDFKPDNAIVGEDRRVRVVDFGLACEADDPASATRRCVGGTPGFIAPELAAGGPVTAAADQYSFCVALAGALEGAADAPARRIVAAVARGRAADPAQRFASMPELLRALARDPATRGRRIAAAATVAAFAAAFAFALGRGGDDDPCGGGAQRIAAVWRGRDAALARVAGQGVYGASLRPLLERELDAYARRWIVEDRAACRAGRDGTQSDLMSERRLACVRRGRDSLAAVRMLVEAADGQRLFELPRAVQAMPDPAACGDRELLSLEVARPPAMLAPRIAELRQTLERARVLIGAGRYEPAQAVAREAVAQARPLAYPPLIAEALLVEGHAAMNRDREAAVAVLVEATRVALEADAYAVAIEAWARRAWAQGTLRGPAEALAGLDVVEPLARRAPAFVRALLFNNVGSVKLADGRIAEARGWFARARGEAKHVVGNGALELLNIEFNLAVASPELAQADALIGEAIEQLTARLGAEHPDTLTLRQERTMVAIEDVRRAEAELARVCPAEAAYPDMVGKSAACWSELGQVRWDLGRRDDAIAAFTRAQRLDEDSRELAATARLAQGDAAGAVALLAAALDDLAPQPDDPWWIRQQRGRLALGLGRARRALGQPAAARRSLELAVSELRAVASAHAAAIFARWLGRAQRELVDCLGELGDPTGGREAADAAAWQRRVGLGDRAGP